MSVRLVLGTKENILVTVKDASGAITDLAPLSPKYTFDNDVPAHVYNAATAVAAVAATGTLTSDATNPANNDTVVINGQTWTFKTALTPAAGEVFIGATAADSLVNLKAAINAEAGGGTLYGAGQTANGYTITGITSTTLTVTATTRGDSGNAITTTETSAHLSFGSGTLTGGTGGTDPMTLTCFIDTTSGNPTAIALTAGTYKLYVHFTNGAEVPKLYATDVTLG